MIESISFRVCIWDNLTLEESPIYRTLVEENGVKFANRHTKRIDVRLHPPPRGNDDAGRGNFVVMGEKRGYQLYSGGGLLSQAECAYTLEKVEVG